MSGRSLAGHYKGRFDFVAKDPHFEFQEFRLVFCRVLHREIKANGEKSAFLHFEAFKRLDDK